LSAQVKPKGDRGGGYLFLVETEDFTVKVAGEAQTMWPGLVIELRSHFPHAHPSGAQGAVEEALCWTRDMPHQQRRRLQQAHAPAERARLREVEAELANLVASFTHARVDAVRERLVLEMEPLTAEQESLRQRVRDQTQRSPTSNDALTDAARRAARSVEKALTLLQTKWTQASLSPQQALMQWVVERVTLTQREDRWRLDGEIIWRGGQVATFELIRRHAARKTWDEREQEILRRWYARSRWGDLFVLLPDRSKNAIVMQAGRMGLASRPCHAGAWQAIPTEQLRELTPPAPSTRSWRANGEPSRSLQSAGLESALLVSIAQQSDPHVAR
jgi:hypothetical protein